MKKILLSCFACSPYKGSEAMCSWQTALALSKDNKVFVLTRESNKKDIDSYFLNKEKPKNIEFIYLDSRIGRKLFSLSSKFYFLYYKLWQKSVYKKIKKREIVKNIDVIHHITLGDFREIGHLWKIDKPFIFGPVGGGQVTPKSLKKYIKGHRINEYIRILINYLCIKSFKYRKAIKKAKYILCANQETLDYIKKYHVKYENKFLLITENGLNESQYLKEEKKFNDKIKFMWCGRLIYRKGLQIILECLKDIKEEIHFDIYGDGPEKNKLLKYIKKNDIKGVNVISPLPYNEILKKYKEYDVFVFPSIRETTGTVLLEAMANKMPILTFNQNGASNIIFNKELLINCKQDLKQIIFEIKEKITKIIRKEYNLSNISKENYDNCWKYIWDKKASKIIKLYEMGVD